MRASFAVPFFAAGWGSGLPVFQRDYAKRMVNYAFQTTGNIEIAAFNPTPELIQKLHREARDIEAERMKESVTVQEAPHEAPRLRLR